MNTKLKIATSLILTGSLAFSPIGSLIQQNNNVVKANEKVSINSNIDIQKHINYIDSQIYLENNKLKINKDIVLNYIKLNFSKLNIDNKYKTPDEYYNDIELSITNLNNKVNSGYYKFNNKGITEKYKSRIGGSYYNNSYWWGDEYLTYNSSQKAELSRDLSISGSVMAGGGSLTYWVPIIAAGFGISATSYYIMSARVGAFWSDRLKLKIFRTGLYHTIDAI